MLSEEGLRFRFSTFILTFYSVCFLFFNSSLTILKEAQYICVFFFKFDFCQIKFYVCINVPTFDLAHDVET